MNIRTIYELKNVQELRKYFEFKKFAYIFKIKINK